MQRCFLAGASFSPSLVRQMLSRANWESGFMLNWKSPPLVKHSALERRVGFLGGSPQLGSHATILLFSFLLMQSVQGQEPAAPDRPPPDSQKAVSQKEDRPKVEFAQKEGEPKEISFDDLVFEMEKGGKFERSMLTEKILQMNGERIRIRGFIRPAFKETGISKFVFVRDNQECCFGPGAALYDCILVELGGEKTTDYTVRPITVLGTLYMKEFKGPDGNIWAIYRMKNASVE